MKKISKYIIIASLLVNVLGTKSFAQDSMVKRLEGRNRIETSIEVSKSAFEKSKTAIIVGYNGEVDALTGTILAHEKNAPILISQQKSLDKSLVDELKRLEVRDIYIIGGKSVVDPIVEKGLKDLKFNVIRIMGKSREETAINVAKEAIKNNPKEAFLALGYGVYADALAIGPIAASKNVPLLLTHKEKISKSTLDYLKEIGVKNVTIVGGDGAVGKNVEKALKDIGIASSRIKGNSREETAVNIANKYLENPKGVIVANGYKYADAVVGGYLGAKENSPILLSASGALKDVNMTYIRDKGLATTVLGGKSSIGELILKSIKNSHLSTSEEVIESPVPNAPDTGVIIAPSLGIESKPEVETSSSNKTQLKAEMKRGLQALKNDIKIPYAGKITSEEVRELIRDIYSDGSYIGGAIKSITPSLIKKGDGFDIVLSAQYYNTIAEEAFIDSEVSRIIKNIIKPNMNEFQKVKTIHDYIIRHTVYSTETIKTPHSVYALLKEGKGVCQGYTLLAYRFFEQMGIENYYVIGTSAGSEGWGSHSWNLVKIDGKYYNLDITKDDPLVVDGNHVLTYKYFLVSDKKFSKTHKVNKDIFPNAVDTRYEALNGLYNPVEYKDNFYFGNKEDNDKLYKLSLNDLKPTKLSDNRAPYLVVYGDKIYFSNYTSGGHLYSSDLNGKSLKQLNKVHSTHLSLQHPYINFFNKTTNKMDKINIK